MRKSELVERIEDMEQNISAAMALLEDIEDERASDAADLLAEALGLEPEEEDEE